MNTKLTAVNAAHCPLTTYSTKELAALYGVCKRTMERWLKPFEKKIGRKKGWAYSVLQVEKIFSYLGQPF